MSVNQEIEKINEAINNLILKEVENRLNLFFSVEAPEREKGLHQLLMATRQQLTELTLVAHTAVQEYFLKPRAEIDSEMDDLKISLEKNGLYQHP